MSFREVDRLLELVRISVFRIACRMRIARASAGFPSSEARFQRDQRDLMWLVFGFAERNGFEGRYRVVSALQMASWVPFPAHRSGGLSTDLYGFDYSIPGMVYQLWAFENQEDLLL